MNHVLPKLPYANDALAPVISKETIDFHYGKHYQTYVDNLNKLVKGTEYENMRAEDIVANAPDGGIFNNAGQVVNHGMYFFQFTPKPERKEPHGELAKLINEAYVSFENFKEVFTNAAITLFGSGWAWLSLNEKNELVITKEHNGHNPLRYGYKPLLCFDVWEHAYYLDFQNRRADHLKGLWNIIDWKVVEERMME